MVLYFPYNPKLKDNILLTRFILRNMLECNHHVAIMNVYLGAIGSNVTVCFKVHISNYALMHQGDLVYCI